MTLERYLNIREELYDQALLEIRNGKKESNWMYYVFPQLKKLARSATAEFFGFESLFEAKEYLDHPVLSSRIITTANELLKLKPFDQILLFDEEDSNVLKSSMTLFSLLSEPDSVFSQVLLKYFDGCKCEVTERVIDKELNAVLLKPHQEEIQRQNKQIRQLIRTIDDEIHNRNNRKTHYRLKARKLCNYNFDDDLEEGSEAEKELGLCELTELQKAIRRRKESFQEMMFRLIDHQGFYDTEVYQRAWIDRKYFSKIRGGDIPKKRTVMALCLSLRLDLDTAADFMRKAGYAFSNADVSDIIVSYCLEHAIYDLAVVNSVLDHYHQPVLRG